MHIVRLEGRPQGGGEGRISHVDVVAVASHVVMDSYAEAFTSLAEDLILVGFGQVDFGTRDRVSSEDAGVDAIDECNGLGLGCLHWSQLEVEVWSPCARDREVVVKVFLEDPVQNFDEELLVR
eukprot:scaffold113955_cov28-Attheya_sp.AAC.5